MNPEQETNMLREEENELNLIDMYRVVRANWYCSCYLWRSAVQ